MVYRIYVEKKKGLDNEARALYSDLSGILKISGLSSVRVINRYDVENIDKELFDYFDGKISLDEAVRRIQVDTRHYAKRQLTWWRRDTSIRWIPAS